MRLMRALAAATIVATTLTVASPAWADGAPVVTQEPASETVAPGGAASFTATAAGTPAPSVSWLVSTDNGATFRPASVTSTTLTVPNVTLSENGNEFRAVFTNASGTVNSTSAVLSVAQGAGNLVVTVEPTDQAVSQGGTVTFASAATGNPPPTVEWEVSSTKGRTWAATGITAPNLRLVNVPASANGNQYRAVFSNPGGLLATAPATLTVAGAPPPGTANVTLPPATAGQAYTVTLTATGGKAPYTWSLDAASGLPAGLALSPAGVISGTPSRPGTATVTAHVADSSNPPQIATETLSLTVNSPCPHGNATFVCQAYVALLGRSPAPPEVGLWVNALTTGVITQQGIALAIASSPEYRADLVQSFFAAYLRRAADAAGVATNVGLLAGGATDEAVQAGILGSPEYFANRGASTSAGFVAALYKTLVGRVPSPAEATTWQQQLDQGTSRTQIAAGILNSPEYRGDFVALEFQRLLGRPVDGGGLTAWVSALTGGETDEQAIAGLVSSPEFINRA